MIYDLPKSVEVCGATYDIRSDYRAVLDICTALNDPELNDQDKAIIILDIFYPSFSGESPMPQDHYEEAILKCFWFIGCGESENKDKKAPKLMDWEQDFKYIVAPINRVVGHEVRAVDYMHWWSFMSAYYEIGGDCLFSQIISVRDKLSKGKKLDKADKEWYQKNKEMVDLKNKYTVEETDAFKQWLV
jgi:hypothetical protein